MSSGHVVMSLVTVCVVVGLLPHLVGFITARLDVLQGLKDRSLGED